MRIALASDHAGFAEKEKLKYCFGISAWSLRTWAQSLKRQWIIPCSVFAVFPW
jgi:hypothetical protein